MAQSTLITTGTTEVTSADTIVNAGSIVTVGLFVASGNIPMATSAQIFVKTPSANTLVGSLNAATPVLQIQGPGTIVVKRLVTTTSVGVFLTT
jgi:hypothetical protein